MSDIEEIIGNFAVLDDWDDRYRYLIELGRELSPLAEAAELAATKNAISAGTVRNLIMFGLLLVVFCSNSPPRSWVSH